jgi:RNA polymerase sigma-70 factor (ECF subfamily)
MTEDHGFDELLRRVREGDERATAEMVRRYEPEVRRFIRYRLTSGHLRRFLDSLDVCQSVFANFFLRLTEGQFELKNPEQVQRLLRVMAGNRLLDHHRRQTAARRACDAVPLGETADLPGDADDPTRTVEARDLVEALRARLSAEERRILDVWMQGEDWPEVARQLGSTADAVRKRFTRAIDRVARDMGWEDQE